MRGITIVEITGVMAFLGVVAFAAIVMVRSGEPARLDAAAKQVQSDIQYARQLALTSTVIHGVQFVSGGNYTVYRSAVDTPVSSPLTHQNLVTTLSAKFPGVTIQNNYTVEFDSLGAPATGGGGSVTIGNASGTKTISVRAGTGSVTIQ